MLTPQRKAELFKILGIQEDAVVSLKWEAYNGAYTMQISWTEKSGRIGSLKNPTMLCYAMPGCCGAYIVYGFNNNQPDLDSYAFLELWQELQPKNLLIGITAGYQTQGAERLAKMGWKSDPPVKSAGTSSLLTLWSFDKTK